MSEDPDFLLPIGSADVKREGRDVTVIAYGMMVHLRSRRPRPSPARVSTSRYSTSPVQPDRPRLDPRLVAKTSHALVLYETHPVLGIGAEVAT